MFRKIILGLGRLPGYGPHPGTTVLLILVLCGALVGRFVGAGIMLAVYGPIYLYGAYERGAGYLRRRGEEL